jgi:hypothetical protein
MGFINIDEMASVYYPFGEIIYQDHGCIDCRVAKSGYTKSRTLLLFHELSRLIHNIFFDAPKSTRRLCNDKVFKMYFSAALLLPLAALALARPQEAAPAAAGSRKNVYLASCTSRSLLDSM